MALVNVIVHAYDISDDCSLDSNAFGDQQIHLLAQAMYSNKTITSLR